MQQWLTMNTQLICVILCTQVYRCILRVTRRGELLSTTATQARHSFSIRCGSISELWLSWKRGTNSIEMCSVFTGAKWTKVQLRFNSLLLNFNSWRKCTQKKANQALQGSGPDETTVSLFIQTPGGVGVGSCCFMNDWRTGDIIMTKL